MERRAAARVLAWDLPTRLFKWSLVACIAAAWATNKYAVDRPYLHVWNGEAVLVLLVFRLFWGIVGGSTARFSAFVTWPWTAARSGLRQIRGEDRPYLGHTPIGGMMIVALLVALLCQTSLGLYSSDPDRLIVEGPLAETVSDAIVRKASALHAIGFDIILVLASAHIVANLLYALARKGLIIAMITGRKPAAAYADADGARPGSLPKAAACLVAAIALVFGTIVLLGGHPLE